MNYIILFGISRCLNQYVSVIIFYLKWLIEPSVYDTVHII